MSTNKIVQVKMANTGPARQTITSATPLPITNLSVDFTPQFSDSIIIVRAQINTSATHVSSFAVYKDGSPTVSTSGYTNSNYANMQVTTYIGSSSTNELWNIPIIWSETSGSIAQRTYQIYAIASWSTTNYALHINNRNSNDMAGFSHMTVTEVRP